MSYLTKLTQEAKVSLLKELISDLKLADMEGSEATFELVDIGDIVDPALDRRNSPDKGWGLSTGYQELDKATGGFAKGEMIVVAGGTGQGKSLLVQSIMVNMALDNIPSLFFTLEMPAIDSTDRFIDMGGMYGGSEVLKTLPIVFFKGPAVNLKVLDASIAQAVKKNIQIVFIDHLHFFSKGSENMSSEIGHIAREIKLMALKYDVPIVLISHIRKTGAPSKIPTLEDLKDSSGIAQDADMVLMIWRNMDSVNEEEQKVLKVKIRKNRRKGILTGCQYRLDEHNYLKEEPYGHTDIKEI